VSASGQKPTLPDLKRGSPVSTLRSKPGFFRQQEVRSVTDQAKSDCDKRELRLEKARTELLKILESLRGSTLTQKEADAVEAAIEDELIALRVGPLLKEQ
jgi:hypothetical protein